MPATRSARSSYFRPHERLCRVPGSARTTSAPSSRNSSTRIRSSASRQCGNGTARNGIIFAHRSIAEHEVLQRILGTEPELLTPQLTIDAPRVLSLLQTFFVGRFGDHELADGLSPADAAEYVARMTLSFISSPGRWDLSDQGQVRRLVRSEILAGVTP